MAKLQIGQTVEAEITRSGGKTIKIVGEIVRIETAFGREDVVVGKGVASDFTVNKKNVKLVKIPVK